MIPICWVQGSITVPGLPVQHFEDQLSAEEIPLAKDAAKQLIGDGLARVSTSLELKDSSFGKGFGVFVTVSLACDQSEKALQDAHAIALGLAEEFTGQAYANARELFRTTVPQEER